MTRSPVAAAPLEDWLATTLAASRPRGVAALLRYFRDLDLAEEAWQEACLRALQRWPLDGPPADPLAWLILVGRNAGLDTVRQARRLQPLDATAEDLLAGDPSPDWTDRHDDAPYRDDLLRLLFVCCHPELPVAQQIALALRVVSGLSVAEIARAFLVSESAMEQRITRAKRRVATTGIAFETPGAPQRQARLAAVCTTLYLLFNEGYSATSGAQPVRVSLCDEAIRLVRLLCDLAPDDPEVAGLLALMLLQHARSAARVDAAGELVLLEDQDRSLWHAGHIEEGLRLLDAALRRSAPGPYQVQAAIAAMHVRARCAEDTDWDEIDRLYEVLERMQPSPVVTLNRAVAVAQRHGPGPALALIEPLGEALGNYFNFHGVRGALLERQGHHAEARDSFARALGLARTAAEAAHIRRLLDRLALRAD
jgi:RNA polymerase sigma-70 factor (ECF subfamily)